MSAQGAAGEGKGGAGGAAGPGAAGPGAGGPPAGFNPELANMATAQLLIIVYIAAVAHLAVYNLVSRSARYIRRMATMNSDTQKYFRTPNSISNLKRYLIYAPLFKQRHHKELMLGKIRFGTIPSRLETLLLLGLVGFNTYLLVKDLPIPLPKQALPALYNRAATLACVNLIPLFFFAGRKNPFIGLTGIDFNNFNTMHRWIGRLVVAFIIVHAAAIIIPKAMEDGSQGVMNLLFKVEYIKNGYIASLALVAIVLQSAPYLRKPFYETFLITHQALAAVFLAFAIRHTAKFWQTALVGFAATTWVIDRVIRFLNLLRNNVGKNGTKILAEALPGDAMRITIYAARPWTVKPGQHIFLYLPGISLWQSHPFSIAWSEQSALYAPSPSPDSYEIEKGNLVSTTTTAVPVEASMSLIVRKRSGATSTLYNRVVKAGGRLSCRAAVEGPYGGLHSLNSYGTVLLFAGGVGITHQVPYIRRLVEGYAQGTVSCRKLVMVWSIQSPEHLEWVRPWMTSILGMDGRRDLLRIMIFVTRPDPNNPQALDVQSPSASVKMFPGRRPDVASIVEAEAVDQVGTMAIGVCGSGDLSDTVRAEARKRTKFGNVDFFDESFSW